MFGRKKKKALDDEELGTDSVIEDEKEQRDSSTHPKKPVSPASAASADSPSSPSSADSDEEDDEVDVEFDDEDELEAEPDEWDELDQSQDWRDDGPFDIEEVDLSDDHVERLDLDTLILTPRPGTGLQLQIDQATSQVVAALCAMETSGMEVALFAAPLSGGVAREMRRDLAEHVDDPTKIEFAAGPFGTETRVTITGVTPEGERIEQPGRMWIAEGPRWALRAMIFGKAAVEFDCSDSFEFEEFFRDIVVRRGDAALPPGEIIPMIIPEEMKPQQ